MAEQSTSLTIAQIVKAPNFRDEAEKALGRGAQSFLSSVLSLANSSPALKALDPIELYNTCLMAGALRLPFNGNLGQAYIIPYKGHPQLQIGWKGFVQLAQRSGLFKTIGVTPVRENEIKGVDPLTNEIIFDFKLEKSGKIVGYMAYFRLLNGFEKNLYMTVGELERHAKKYSQSYKSGGGIWKENFEAMANKTVIKLLLNRYAPLTVESDLARAIELDQSDHEGDYTDNRPKLEVTGGEFGSSETDKAAK